MKNAALLLALFALSFFGFNASAQNSASCPNMNGTFTHKQLFVTANLTVTQSQCDSMTVVLVVRALGNNMNQIVSSQLDGVTRDVPNPPAGEKDTISGKFEGDTVVFTVDRYPTNGSHSTSIVSGTLTDSETMEVNLDGKSYSFNRN